MEVDGEPSTAAAAATPPMELGPGPGPSLDLDSLDERARQASLVGADLSSIVEAQDRRRIWLKRVNAARKALWSSVEQSSGLISSRSVAVDPQTVLRYATMISSTTSAPLGYSQDGGQGQTIHLPYPDEATMRRGRLAGFGEQVGDEETRMVEERGRAFPDSAMPESFESQATTSMDNSRAPILGLDLDSDGE